MNGAEKINKTFSEDKEGEFRPPEYDAIEKIPPSHEIYDEETAVNIKFKYVSNRIDENGKNNFNEAVGALPLKRFRWEKDEKGNKFMLLGRNAFRNDAQDNMSSQYMSREHAKITVSKEGEVVFEDLDSKNGTKKIDPPSIKDVETDVVGKHGIYLLPLDITWDYSLAIEISKREVTTEQERHLASKKFNELHKEINNIPEGELIPADKIIEYAKNGAVSVSRELADIHNQIFDEVVSILSATQKDEYEEAQFRDSGLTLAQKYSVREKYAQGITKEQFLHDLNKRADIYVDVNNVFSDKLRSFGNILFRE